MFFKPGLLTRAFYAILTLLLEVALWAVVHFNGVFGLLYPRQHMFLSLGARLGAVFGALWLISFIAAWWIVYLEVKTRLSTISR